MEEDVDEFVETSDAEELAEIQGLFYAGPQGRRARRLAEDDEERDAKRRKTSHASSDEPSEFSEPMLFEETPGSREDTPLSFPESDAEPDLLNILKSPSPASSLFSALSPSPAPASSAPAVAPSLPPTPPPPAPNADAALAQALAPRRNLRQRQPHQQQPYTYDRLAYKLQLKNAPEAFVHIRQLEKEDRDDRRRAQQEESQYQPLEEEEEEEEPPQQDSLALQPLNSSDDDEEIRKFRRETRKLVNENKKKQEKAEKHTQKAKAFPVQAENAIAGPSNHLDRYNSPPPRSRHLIASPVHSPSSSPILPLRMARALTDISQSRLDSPMTQPQSPTPDSPMIQPQSPQASSESESGSSESSDSWQAKKARKQARALKKMLPRFMIPAAAVGAKDPQGEGRRTHSSQHSEIDIDNDQDNLRPGRARVRWRKGRPVGEIKGDTESEAEEVVKPSGSCDLDSIVAVPILRARSASVSGSGTASPPSPRRYTIHIPEPIETIELTSSSSSSSGSDSGSERSQIDDDDIAFFVHRGSSTRQNRPDLKEDMLIDYMLAKGVVISGPGSKKRKKVRESESSRKIRIQTGDMIKRNGQSKLGARPKSRSRDPYGSNVLSGSSKPRYKFNIVRPGQGGGRQTLLPFQRKDKAKDNLAHNEPSTRGQYEERLQHIEDDSEEEESSDDSADEEDHSHPTTATSKPKKLTWNQRVKQRKEAERMQGVYTHVAEPGTRILGGEQHQSPEEEKAARKKKIRRKSKAKSKSKEKSTKRNRRREGKRIHYDDEHDDEFRRALAPPSSSQPASQSQESHPRCRSISKDEQEQQQEREKHPDSDFSALDFTFLPPGKCFGFNTYIRKGKLHEMVQLMMRQPFGPLSSTPPSAPGSSAATPATTSSPLSVPTSSPLPLPSSPVPCQTDVQTLNVYHSILTVPLSNSAIVPTTFSLLKSLSSFLKDFPVLCVSLGDFVCGRDNDATLAADWSAIMRGVGGILAELLNKDHGTADIDIQSKIEQSLAALITRIDSEEEVFKESSIKPFKRMPMLDACWFMVEVAVCAGFKISDSIMASSSVLQDACHLLVRCLLEYDPGLRDVMVLMRDQDPTKREMNSPDSVVQRVAELWVCLIHTLKPWPKDECSNPRSHPLWPIVLTELKCRSAYSVKTWSLRANETIWQTIFSLCALSQFSEHGLCKDKPTTLTGSLGHWGIVLFALSQVQLKVEAETENLPLLVLQKRDKYISVIVTRCFLLVTCWGWTLPESPPAFKVLKALSEIFSSRRYRNLYHEKGDFPEFLRTQRWESCFEYHPKRDSAFILFLKLVVQAGSGIRKSYLETGHTSMKDTESRLRRLLSLISPVSSMPFTKTKPPQGNELSMLYNRMATTAVALHLRPSDYKSRIEQAQLYVDFQSTDDTSRIACTRSLMYLSQMMILDKTADTESVVSGWFVKIINVLIGEYKELEMKHGVDPNAEKLLNRVRFLMNLVLGSIRHILSAYNDPDVEVSYPDCALLDVVLLVGRQAILIENSQTAREVMAITRTFLLLREKVVPVPERPLIKPLPNAIDLNDSQESQDAYGDMDIDMNDPAFEELLRGSSIGHDETSLDLASETQAKDKAASKALGQLSWVLYRCLKRIFDNYPKGQRPSTHYMENIDTWIDTWLQSADVAIMHSTSSWFSRCLDLRDTTWGAIGDVRWRRRIDIRVAFNILTRAPKSYQDITLYCIETFFDALVPIKEVTVEHDFIARLLTIDGLRHPLLRDLPIILPHPPEIYALTAEKFVLLRDVLLGAILDNIEQSLRDEESNNGQRTVVGESSTNKLYGDLLARYLNNLKEMSVTLELGSKERKDYELKCRQIMVMIFDNHPRIGMWGRLDKWDVWRRGLD